MPKVQAQGYFTIHFFRTNNYADSKVDMNIMVDDKLASNLSRGGKVTYTALYVEKVKITATGKKCKTLAISLEPRKGSEYLKEKIHYYSLAISRTLNLISTDG